MVNVLGLDIGGANTKATFLATENGAIKKQKTALEYFPFWKNGKSQLPEVLKKLKNELTNSTPLDGVGVTITAELSDAYVTKKEGVNHVLDCVCQVFGDTPLFVLDVEACLVSVEAARKRPLRVASANWAATGWITKHLIKNCVVIDVGSTSTSIIPVINGKIAAEGKTDLEKLQNGELVYSGALRTNIAAIVDSIPVRGRMTRVSSELFSQTADVHLILGNITKQDYTAETSDGRGKTIEESLARLAHVVCTDTDMLTATEITEMAKYVYQKQVEQIASSLKQVKQRVGLQKNVAVVTGIGRNFLAKKAAQQAGFEDIIDMRELLGSGGAVASPSAGVAFMVAEKLEGKTVEWKRS